MTERLKIYLETSVISYLVARPSSNPEKALRQAYTLRWMEKVAPYHDLCVSNLVFEEAIKGDPEAAARRYAEIAKFPLVTFPETEMVALARELRSGHQALSGEAADAGHIAICSVAGVDVLLTWNCRHLANALELPKTEAIVRRLGYACPRILTPKTHLEERHVE